MTEAALRIELVTRRSEIPLDAGQWNALVAANETNTIFQTFEWFDAWWKSFGAGRRLYFLVVRDGETIVGFAALARRRSRFGWRVLEFAGTGNADYQDFVLPTDKPRQLEAICRFLRARRFSWERLALYNVPAQSSTHAALRAASVAAGLKLVDEIRVDCPALTLGPDSTRARGLINKYSLRRPLNWFRKRGEVRFRHVESIEEIAAFLPAFFEQHRRRWHAVGETSLFTKEQQRHFYEALARSLHPRGWLQFSVVEFNREPIAFHFGFDYDGCITWYKPSFDTRYAGHSPGLLLTRQLIADGLERARRELDFTIGDEAFKGRFCSHQRHNLYFGMYPGPVSGMFARVVGKLRRVAGRTFRRLRNSASRIARIEVELPDVTLPDVKLPEVKRTPA
jgi:CelD/BcsL family acetyltransferase involved in cellulose biosynthesis